jgi:O-antigen ligase
MASEASTTPDAGLPRGGSDWRAAPLPSQRGVGLLAAATVLLGLLWLVADGAYALAIAPFALLLGAYLLLRQPDWAAPAFAFLLYTNVSAVATQIHDVPFAVAAMLPGLLLVPIARDFLLRRLPPVLPPALPFILAFLAVQLAGALTARRPDEAMEAVTTSFLEGLVLYVLVTHTIRTPAVLRQVLWSLLAAGGLMGALVAFQHLTGTYENDYGGFAQVDVSGIGFVLDATAETRQPRIGGPLGMPNRFAQIMAILVPLALFQIQASRRRGAKLAAAACLGLIMVGFSLGFSRGAAVGLGATFLVTIALGHVSLRQLAVVGLGLAGVALLVPQYAVRLASLAKVADAVTDSAGPGLGDADSSTQGRITEMVAGVLIFADHPLLGVGPEMYRRHYPEYARVAGGRVRPNTREAHSLPIHIGAEHGALGLGLFGAIFLVTLRQLWKARQRLIRLRSEQALLVTGVLLALVTFLTTSVFLHASFIRYQWFLLALAAATARVMQGAPVTPPARLVRLVRVREVDHPARRA